MSRKEFVFRLFNNGHGLTLDQIERMENEVHYNNQTIPPAELRAAAISVLERSDDLIDLRNALRETNGLHDVTDAQVYGLFTALCKF